MTRRCPGPKPRDTACDTSRLLRPPDDDPDQSFAAGLDRDRIHIFVELLVDALVAEADGIDALEAAFHDGVVVITLERASTEGADA
jgi:hypothetical protein